MLNNKLKNKLILSFLMALNIISIHAAPAIVVQRNGVETVLNLRQTVPERVKLAWKKLDPNVKNVITGAAYSLTMMAIVMHMQSNQFSANDFKLTKSSEIDIKFDDLIGLTRPKEEIKDFIDYAKDPASFNKMGAEPIKGLLLYGPPGTGKTELARATAKEADLNFIALNGSDFKDMWQGAGAKKLRALDKFAKENAGNGIIVFIDEIDSIISKDHGLACSDSKTTINELKTMIDGFEKSNSNIFYLAAANAELKHLDSAIIRDGRLTPVYVGTPNDVELSQIFKKKLYSPGKNAEKNIDTAALANLLPSGSTGATVTAIVNQAAKIRRHSNKPIDFDLLKLAISQRG